tara:strand:- start:212 stop:919 length:708 start_codon:yes stop_codon:yes gene_type:complete
MSDIGDDDYLSEPEPDEKEDNEKEDNEKEDNESEKITTINPTAKIQSDLNNNEDSSNEELELSDQEFEPEESDNEEELEQTNPTISSTSLMGESENTLSPINSDVESEDEEEMQKFDEINKNNYIYQQHPECITLSSNEINALSKIIRVNNIIKDPFHKTNPILTKYEKTKILGLRTKQLNNGSKPNIPVPSGIIDSYLIAQLELKAKKIPIIIRRPLSNGTSEYWKITDLEQVY